jgi:hypothetical protein
MGKERRNVGGTIAKAKAQIQFELLSVLARTKS